MTKAELKKIAKNYLILDCEIEDAIHFVQELLEFYADEIKRDEPYAVNFIRRLEDAAREVSGLIYYLDECEDA